MNVYEYAGSRPTISADPWGLTVTYNFQPQNIPDAPWWPTNLTSHDPRIELRAKTLPTNLNVECKCNCCDKVNDKWDYECTVALDLWIFIDSPGRRWTLESLYGHEQRHVQAMQNKVRELIDPAARRHQAPPCKLSKKECEEGVPVVTELLEALAQAGVILGAGHGGPGQPAERRPEDPITCPVCGHPTPQTLGGNKMRPPAPYPDVPANLKGVWRTLDPFLHDPLAAFPVAVP